jgi:hypothetical protein
VASADPVPELTEPELAVLELELLLDDESDVAELLELSLLAWAAAAPIPIVATAAATARPEVTATAWRRALSRWFIGSSCGR